MLLDIVMRLHVEIEALIFQEDFFDALVHYRGFFILSSKK